MGEEEKQTSQAPPPPPPSSPEGGGEKSSMGMDPKLAGLLSYLIMPITGIIFVSMEKENRFIRFHAVQSIIFGIAAVVIQIALVILGAILGAITAGLGCLVSIGSPIVGLVIFIFWILAMIKAYQGEMYKLPIIGDMAEKYV